MSVYEVVYLPGDSAASTIPPAGTNSELHDPQAGAYQTSTLESAGGLYDESNYSAFPQDESIEQEYWDDLRARPLLDHAAINNLHTNPFSPEDLLQRVRDEVSTRGGKLNYEEGEPTVPQVLMALAALATKHPKRYTPYARPVQRVVDDPEWPMSVTRFHVREEQKIEPNPLAA